MCLYDVTFETKCYERDWEILIKKGRLKSMIDFNCFPFKEKILFINNVSSPMEVGKHAEMLVNQGIITSYVVVEDYAREAMEYFEVTKESFKGGYYYSIAELVSIYLCKTEYLLHFSSDSILEMPFDWLTKAIKRMEADRSIKVANPTWNRRYFEAMMEAFEEEEDFYKGYGFSDQCYLIYTRDFKDKIYNEKNPASKRYPEYGGELFEKRVDAWMRNHHFYRITCKNISYIHRNFN